MSTEATRDTEGLSVINIMTSSVGPTLSRGGEAKRLQFNVWVGDDSLEAFAQSEDACHDLGKLIADTLHEYLSAPH